MRNAFGIVFLILALASCKTVGSGSRSSAKADIHDHDDTVYPSYMPWNWTGPEGTLVVRSFYEESHAYYAVKVGKEISVKPFSFNAYKREQAWRSANEMVYITYDSGEFVILDPKEVKVKAEFKFTDGKPTDLEIVSADAGYLALREPNRVAKIDLKTGKLSGFLDIPAKKGQVIGPMKLHKNKLFLVAQNAEDSDNSEVNQLFVIDTGTWKIIKQLDLSWGDVRMSLGVLPPVINYVAGELWVGSIYNRDPKNGRNVRFSLETLEAIGTYERITLDGTYVFSPTTSYAMYYQHTAFPAPSTHFGYHEAKKDGSVPHLGKAFENIQNYELFRRVDSFSLNRTGKINAVANYCAGFCTTGQGITFFDMEMKTGMPKLYASKLGFIPDEAIFVLP